jgi:aryl-alcohol dehydrogenase-like predicted oxidoreductase
MNAQPLAIGCMRLSTEPDRHDETSIAMLHAAFDAGITLLDTADAYCRDDTERGHNERLLARALSTWHGDRSRITVAHSTVPLPIRATDRSCARQPRRDRLV